jgi:magnesium transporter
MVATSTRLSMVMKRLTSLATIFLPLSFLAGVYGMNFEHLPGQHSPYGFALSCALMASLGIGMFVYFRRQGWW